MILIIFVSLLNLYLNKIESHKLKHRFKNKINVLKEIKKIKINLENKLKNIDQEKDLKSIFKIGEKQKINLNKIGKIISNQKQNFDKLHSNNHQLIKSTIEHQLKKITSNLYKQFTNKELETYRLTSKSNASNKSSIKSSSSNTLSATTNTQTQTNTQTNTQTQAHQAMNGFDWLEYFNTSSFRSSVAIQDLTSSVIDPRTYKSIIEIFANSADSETLSEFSAKSAKLLSPDSFVKLTKESNSQSFSKTFNTTTNSIKSLLTTDAKDVLYSLIFAASLVIIDEFKYSLAFSFEPVKDLYEEVFPSELKSEDKNKHYDENQSEIDLNKDLGAEVESEGDENAMGSSINNSISNFTSSWSPSTSDSFKISMYMNIKSFYSLTNDQFGGQPDPNQNISGQGLCDASFPCTNVGNQTILIGYQDDIEEFTKGTNTFDSKLGHRELVLDDISKVFVDQLGNIFKYIEFDQLFEGYTAQFFETLHHYSFDRKSCLQNRFMATKLSFIQIGKTILQRKLKMSKSEPLVRKLDEESIHAVQLHNKEDFIVCILSNEITKTHQKQFMFIRCTTEDFQKQFKPDYIVFDGLHQVNNNNTIFRIGITNTCDKVQFVDQIMIDPSTSILTKKCIDSPFEYYLKLSMWDVLQNDCSAQKGDESEFKGSRSYGVSGSENKDEDEENKIEDEDEENEDEENEDIEGSQAGTGGSQAGDGGSQAGAGGSQAGAGGSQANAGGSQANAGGSQAGAGGSQAGAGGSQAGAGASQAGDGGSQANAGASQAGDGASQAGDGASQAGDGGSQVNAGDSQDNSSCKKTSNEFILDCFKTVRPFNKRQLEFHSQKINSDLKKDYIYKGKKKKFCDQYDYLNLQSKDNSSLFQECNFNCDSSFYELNFDLNQSEKKVILKSNEILVQNKLFGENTVCILKHQIKSGTIDCQKAELIDKQITDDQIKCKLERKISNKRHRYKYEGERFQIQGLMLNANFDRDNEMNKEYLVKFVINSYDHQVTNQVWALNHLIEYFCSTVDEDEIVLIGGKVAKD